MIIILAEKLIVHLKVIFTVLAENPDKVTLEGEAMDKAKGLGNRIWRLLENSLNNFLMLLKNIG